MDKSGDFMWLSGLMWLSGKKLRKVGKNGKKWGKVRKVAKSREN